ncbi:MAG: hypothetical protein IPK26_11240 [Planctomycetes bacterium]|nr:hypothetical protein [Planctomycetota bacterium]
MSAAAVIPCLVPVIVAVAMRRAEARIHRQLTDAHATTADSAIQLSLSRSMDRRRLQGLVHGGAVHATANGRHFLDSAGWDTYHRNRRRRVSWAASIAIAVVGLILVVVFAVASSKS